MLQVIEREQFSFKELVERAKNTIQEQYPVWTNYNPADSGMTLVELFAFMTEAQQFYVNQTGRSHDLAFLNLLGMSPKGFQPAQVYVRIEELSDSRWLLQGTKITAEHLVFEAESNQYMERDDMLPEQSPFYPFGENPEKQAYCDIPLWYSLSSGIVHSLFIDLYDGYAIARNPIDPEQYIPFVSLLLEYYDGEQYRPCELVKDTTYGLLQTGILQFVLPTEMGKKEQQYHLRLRIEGEYDTAPLIQGMYFNMVSFIQKDTQIEYQDIVLEESTSEICDVKVQSFLAMEGDTRIYAETDNGFCDIGKYYSYLSEDARHFVFARTAVEDVGGKCRLRFVSSAPGFFKNQYCFQGNGEAEQQYFLPQSNILASTFAVWVEETSGYYSCWYRVLDFAGRKPDDRCYILEEEKGIIQFGDGKRGAKPKGKIEIISCAFCAGKDGNIQKNQMNGFFDNTGSGSLTNPFPAKGGSRPETILDCLKRYAEEEQVKHRTVTLKDYEEVIRNASGLRVKKVKVSPSPYDNSLEVVVQPYTSGQRIITGEGYDQNIRRILNRTKLIGTQILLKKPKYINLTVFLDVLVKKHNRNAKEEIEDRVKAYFDEQMDFGKTIVYSRLYGYIDALPQTAGILSLAVHATGSGVVREHNMDIKIPVYGIAFLKELMIRCILQDEI